MEQITVAGHPEPVPASPVAARLLRERLESVREQRGPEAADHLEELVGRRIGTLLDGGAPSIDVATMRSIVEYIELPSEDEPPPTGLGKVVQDLRDKAAQRGFGGHIG
jgi:hypothetical protein